ncbi:hypothetical protein GCM10010460_17280 [Microbacterium terrae]|nr:hypothetical protein GCM10017594_11950 [Microbacterium terrae]
MAAAFRAAPAFAVAPDFVAAGAVEAAPVFGVRFVTDAPAVVFAPAAAALFAAVRFAAGFAVDPGAGLVAPDPVVVSVPPGSPDSGVALFAGVGAMWCSFGRFVGIL